VKQHILSHIAARKAPPGRYADGAGLWLHKREGAVKARQCATQSPTSRCGRLWT